MAKKRRSGAVKFRNFYSKKIKALRKSMQLTQTEFADMIGVSLTSVSNYECGKTKPSPRTMTKIITIFGESARELCEEYLSALNNK